MEKAIIRQLLLYLRWIRHPLAEKAGINEKKIPARRFRARQVYF